MKKNEINTKSDINNLKDRVGEEAFGTLLGNKETKNNDIEIDKKNKWIMEVTPTSIGVEHPKDYDFEKLPTEMIQLDNIVGFEPDEKIQQEMSSRAVIELSEKIKNGTYDAPPIMVRKYKNGFQVVDGHHRFHAHKLAGSKTINAKVIPQEDINYRDHRIQSANRL